MNVVVGTKEIPVTPPTDGVFVEVLSAWDYNGLPLPLQAAYPEQQLDYLRRGAGAWRQPGQRALSGSIRRR